MCAHYNCYLVESGVGGGWDEVEDAEKKGNDDKMFLSLSLSLSLY